MAFRMGYAYNGRTMTHVHDESWQWDGQPTSCPTGYTISWAREFRYDGARARYLNRELDPVALLAGNFVSLADTWTDYDGDEPYGDYTVSGSVATNLRSYQPGLAVGEWGQNNDPPTASSTDDFVMDHLGTTRGMTLPSGFPDQGATFTAFGEKVAGFDHRFGYVGAYGYQEHAEMPYLHVGLRYYDPASGRFLQRDPIGIRGELNTYSYVGSSPGVAIDPEGLWRSEMIPDWPVFREAEEQRRRAEEEQIRRDNFRDNMTPIDPAVELVRLRRNWRTWNKFYRYLGYAFLLTPGGQVIGIALHCGAELQQEAAGAAGVGF